MNLKALFFSTAALMAAGSLSAQDKIYKRNGDVIDGKVHSVDSKTVSYRRADNPKGPEYIMNKSDLEKVEYENGAEDVFSDRKRSFRDDDDEMESGREVRGRASDRGDRGRASNAKKRKKIDYGNNLLTLSPIHFTENGFGLGLSYEHAFGKKGIVALNLPVVLTFGSPQQDFLGNSGLDFNSYTNVAFMPGIKIYAGGNKGKVRYGVAPSFLLVLGQKDANYYVYDQNGVIQQVSGMQDHVEVGAIITHSLNMNPSKHMYIGLDLGMGIAFIDEVGGHSTNDTPMPVAQFALKFGYRF